MKLLEKLDPHRLLKSCHVYWRLPLILGVVVIGYKIAPSGDVDKPKVSVAVSGSVAVESTSKK